MVDDEVLAVFLAVVVVVGVFSVSQTLFSGVVADPFSELGLLGPDMKMEDYPTTVVAGQSFDLYLYIGNHEGKVMYYRVLVKLGDQTSNLSEDQPLDATPLTSYEAVIQNGENQTTPITLSLMEPGENKRLVFELWIYNEETDVFNYHSRYCQLWLNVTNTP